MLAFLSTQPCPQGEITGTEAVVAICFMALLGWCFYCLTRYE